MHFMYQRMAPGQTEDMGRICRTEDFKIEIRHSRIMGDFPLT